MVIEIYHPPDEFWQIKPKIVQAPISCPTWFQSVVIDMASPERLIDLLVRCVQTNHPICSHKEAKRIVRQNGIYIHKPASMRGHITDVNFVVDRTMSIRIGPKRTYSFCFNGERI